MKLPFRNLLLSFKLMNNQPTDRATQLPMDETSSAAAEICDGLQKGYPIRGWSCIPDPKCPGETGG